MTPITSHPSVTPTAPPVPLPLLLQGWSWEELPGAPGGVTATPFRSPLTSDFRAERDRDGQCPPTPQRPSSYLPQNLPDCHGGRLGPHKAQPRTGFMGVYPRELKPYFHTETLQSAYSSVTHHHPKLVATTWSLHR